jgi:hypothetical protein
VPSIHLYMAIWDDAGDLVRSLSTGPRRIEQGWLARIASPSAVASRPAGLQFSTTSPWNHGRNRLPPKQRPVFLRSLYPSGLTLQDGRIGTAETPWLIAGLETVQGPNEELVPPTGFEPVLPA